MSTLNSILHRVTTADIFASLSRELKDSVSRTESLINDVLASMDAYAEKLTIVRCHGVPISLYGWSLANLEQYHPDLAPITFSSNQADALLKLKGITITDKRGFAYSFFGSDSIDPEYAYRDNYHILIATSDKPSSWSDIVLAVKLNTTTGIRDLRGNLYIRAVDAANTCNRSELFTIADTMNSNMGFTTYDSLIEGFGKALTNRSNLGLSNSKVEFALHYGISVDGMVGSTSSEYLLKKVFPNISLDNMSDAISDLLVLTTNNCGPTTLISLLNSLSLSATLNDIIADASLFGCGITPFDKIQDMISYRSSLDGSFTNLIDNFQTIITSSGKNGLLMQINQMIGGSEISETDDGTISFTDNDSLMPGQFLAGFVQGLATTIAYAAAAVATVISRIAGAIIALGTALVNKIINLVERGIENLTYAHLTENGSDYIFPTALDQYTLTATEVDDIDHGLASSIEHYGAVWKMFPGFRVLFWKISDEEYGCETHLVPLHGSSLMYVWNSLQACFTAYTVNGDTHYYLGSSKYQDVINVLNNLINLEYGLFESQQTEVPGTNPDPATADQQLQYAYELSYMVWVLSILVSNEYPQTYKPWDSSGNRTILFESDAIAQCIDSLFSRIMNSTGYYRFFSTSINPGDWTDLLTGSNGADTKAWAFARYHNSLKFQTSPSTYANYRDSILLRYSNLNSFFNVSDDECIVPCYTQPVPIVAIPKYDRTTFWKQVIFAAVCTAIIITTAVIATFAIRKKIQAWNAKWKGRAEQAWNNYTDDPTSENYYAYRKAVVKNNILTKMTGGTKMSVVSYWDEVDSEPKSILNDSSSGLLASLNEQTTEDVESAHDDINDIKVLITGVNV